MSSYNKSYYESHKEARKAATKAWKESNIDKFKEYQKAYKEAHKEQMKEYNKAWYEANKESQKEYKKDYMKEYKRADVNALGKTKVSIRSKSQYYLKKYGTKIQGYQIHHCCSYSEPYKFIYCSKEMHRMIHSYLRKHNINADSNHYDYIKHLLDDTVVLYGLD